ncbi:hypothetical protein BT69DRAFT_1342635 [Atractiella rhizophila]|nr:hypothetical protein BT69DRAFT_1342635 [Atractiella rhizophila]
MSTDAQLFDFVLVNKDRRESTIYWDMEKAKEVNFGRFADVLEWGKRCYPLYVKFCDEVQEEVRTAYEAAKGFGDGRVLSFPLQMPVETLQALRDELRLWVGQAALVEEEAVKLGFQPSESANGDPILRRKERELFLSDTKKRLAKEEEERKRAALEIKRRAAEENLRAQKSILAAKGSEVGVVRTLSDHLVTATTFVLPAALGDRNPFAGAPVAEFVVRDGKVRISDKELDAAKYRYFWPGTREAYSTLRQTSIWASWIWNWLSRLLGRMRVRAAPVKAAKKKAKGDNDSQFSQEVRGFALGVSARLSMLVVMLTTFHPKRVGDGKKRPSALVEGNYENISDGDEESPAQSMLSAAWLYSEAFSLDFAQTMLAAARLNAQAAADALKAAELQMELYKRRQDDRAAEDGASEGSVVEGVIADVTGRGQGQGRNAPLSPVSSDATAKLSREVGMSPNANSLKHARFIVRAPSSLPVAKWALRVAGWLQRVKCLPVAKGQVWFSDGWQRCFQSEPGFARAKRFGPSKSGCIPANCTSPEQAKVHWSELHFVRVSWASQERTAPSELGFAGAN